jgi:predicted enzyme related to lactoylglutathione lyase
MSSRRTFIEQNSVLAAALMISPAELLLPKTNSQHMTTAIGNPVVHFEIGCKDLAKTTAFYTGLFGWSPTGIPMASLLATNSPEGIQGHITSLGHEPNNYVTFYIQVDDINDSLKKIEAAGGKKLVGPVTLPDKRQFAWFSDPEGNMVALITK